MRTIAAGILVGFLAGCAHGGHRHLEAADVIDMKKQGMTDAQIVQEVEGNGVSLTLSDRDVVKLVAAGFSQETINEFLKVAEKDEAEHGHPHPHPHPHPHK